MSSVVRQAGIAILQFTLGAAFLYLANRLAAHDPAVDEWVDRFFDFSTFGRDWWLLVLAGMGAALVLLALPSPWRGDRLKPASAATLVFPSPDGGSSGELASTAINGSSVLPEIPVAHNANAVRRPSQATPALTPSFRSRPSPQRPLRQLVVTRSTGRVEE